MLYNGSINELNATTGTLQTARWMAGPTGLNSSGGAITDTNRNGLYGGNGSAALTRLYPQIDIMFSGIPYVLRDMGKTFISSGRTFRKIQFVSGAIPTTTARVYATPAPSNGVAGDTGGNATNSEYLTGYIEVGWEGSGVPAPVVRT